MPEYPIVVDISNYDYDADLDEPQWVQEFINAGVSGVIVGSQWPSKATSQLEALQNGGLKIIGTYAEPDVESAILLAKKYNCSYVGLACERGSIVTHEQLAQDIIAVYNSGLTPWLYGNAGDLENIATNFLSDELVWLASYGVDDPTNPRPPITSYRSPFYGDVTLAAHQYSSTIVIAGRVRDHSYYYLEEDMTPEDTQTLIDKTISDMLYKSTLMNSAQLPELVAQIFGVHNDSYSDQSINEEIRAAYPKDTSTVSSKTKTTSPAVAGSTFTLSGGPSNV